LADIVRRHRGVLGARSPYIGWPDLDGGCWDRMFAKAIDLGALISIFMLTETDDVRRHLRLTRLADRRVAPWV